MRNYDRENRERFDKAAAARFDRNDRYNDKNERGEKNDKKNISKKRGCNFCISGDQFIDYKDRYLLQGFVTERFKIIPRRISGNCAAHQREMTTAIKRARHVAILAYSTAQM